MENLEQLPSEIICGIVAQVTNADDILRLLRTSHRLRDITLECVTDILTAKEKSLPVAFVLPFKRLWWVEVPLDGRDQDEIVALADHPSLCEYSVIMADDLIPIFLGRYCYTHHTFEGCHIEIKGTQGSY